MRRIWLASAGFMLALGSLATVAIVRDRAAVVQSVQERTQSMARLIMAHGEAAIENADKIIASLDGPVRAWDLTDPVEGRRLFALIRELLAGSPQISSAWVTDDRGLSRLDSWTFPPKSIDESARPYFKAHLAKAAEPVILGDARPGAITGKRRFTFSRSQRDSDGALRTVLVVGIYNAYFDRLYAEVASWPGARAGLYSFDGGVLGRLESQPPASPDYLAAIAAAARSDPGGSRIFTVSEGSRLASWQRSAKYPDLYATSSQPIDLALAQWRQRSLVLGLAVGLAGFGLGGLIFFALRSITAREAARQQELLSREVHHRVKNSLQIAASFLNRHARQMADRSARDVLAEASQQVSAIADVHELIQGSASLDRVEICALLQQLCDHLEHGPEPRVAFHAGARLFVQAAQATNVAVVANELITNALKHASAHVAVSCSRSGDQLVVEVRDDGPGLPAGFDLGRTSRFGLRLALSIATQLGGSLTAQTAETGAVFSLRLPVTRLGESESAPTR